MHGTKVVAGGTGPGGDLRRSRWRTVAWGSAAALLLVPLVAMQFTAEVRWGPLDFAAFGAMLAGALGTFELAARRTADRAYLAAVALALAGASFVVWANLAVGIVGGEDDPANLMFFGVLAVGVVGALVGRFRPRGMAHALVAMAIAQALAGVAALAVEPGPALVLTGLYVPLWLASAWLFRRSEAGASSRVW